MLNQQLHQRTHPLFLYGEPSCRIIAIRHWLSYLTVDNLQHLLALGRGGQILVARISHQDTVLYAHAPNIPVLLQNLGVDILSVEGVIKVIRFDVVLGEIAILSRKKHSELDLCVHLLGGAVSRLTFQAQPSPPYSSPVSGGSCRADEP